jgi:siroheme synthase-like protein
MENPLYPVFLRLDKLRILVVGAGPVGLEKLTSLRGCAPEATITVVAPLVHPEIEALADESAIDLKRREVQPGDLETCDLVFLAANNRKLHETYSALARQRNLLCNVADTPDLCDFYLGSIVNKGQLRIAISTNGKSPTLAKRLRELLEDVIPDSINKTLDSLRAIRDRLAGDFETKIREMDKVTAVWRANPTTRNPEHTGIE